MNQPPYADHDKLMQYARDMAANGNRAYVSVMWELDQMIADRNRLRDRDEFDANETKRLQRRVWELDDKLRRLEAEADQ